MSIFDEFKASSTNSEDDLPLLICAPMVRYSKLPFRKLVRKYKCQLCYTPMIVSSCFVRSKLARDAEFTTDFADRPLIVQFAASNAEDLASASELVSPFCDGIDLNCGCPQRWAMAEGYGSHLIYHPELVADMVKQTRRRISRSNFSVSIKIRVHDDFRKTVDLCQQAQSAGVSFITVHGRTPAQRHEPFDEGVFLLAKDSVGIPVVANGDVFSLQDAKRLKKDCRIDGVMSARGILSNPAIYAGYESCPFECIKDWVEISIESGVNFHVFHHILIYMLDKILTKSESRIFNRLQCVPAVVEYLEENFEINCSL